MKVLAIVGSARKQHTWRAAVEFLDKLTKFGDVDYEIIMLSELNLEICKGCKICFDKNEAMCPLNDDRSRIIQKMQEADGVVFATPNYSFHVSGYMKIFIDRLGYFFHRPDFFGKTFTSIVVQGIFGGNKIIKYYNFIGAAMGFNVINGICLTTLEPVTEKTRMANSKKIDNHSKQFYRELQHHKLPAPSVFELMIFRMSRTKIRLMLDENFRDYNFFLEKGWFTSDYYYEVKLNLVKKCMGKFFDFICVKTTTVSDKLT
ncbi:MAG: NAD(P)H-dependent oxidoreductase [Spirochaetes bacterium]|nr:NAD(P)H-dependent oxidoreductase [Spirochaetota bacterium]MBN2772535.1 NAD(P)H-dependent oxidoreductase [Spirochaetota bacterium]